ncbi:hypothetical protein PHMEG_0003914 [Phytophthora megakarya]|uniref:Tyrosinase copper-binding domain-containing protein n=1 Tax=Phytophthora megakarya TaxID=4795 RepID=A0A225WV75_9STRA|nr:hypothetical protein PHMEG_0003914 [Phytophthora megakarya]
MKLVWVLSVTLLAFVSTLSPVSAQCGARIRKDWDSLTTTEKNTYKGALSAAMDSGAYIKFVEIHTEMQSEMEAHRQYCSTITRELGGYTAGSQRTVNINGINNSGRCASQSPLDHFCQSGTVSGSACARCVPRGNWGSATVPSATSFASVRQQVFSGQNIGQMSPAVEQGCHNNMHSNLGGTMVTFASPSDPIFWSHHSMVDALHTIFHKCRVGTQRLTFAQKAAHPVAWTSCAKRGGGTFSPTDVLIMRTGVNGNNPIQGSQDPLIGRYFTGVPNQFAGLMDVRDLGDSSYSYELSGQLADMYNNCDGTSTPAPATAVPTTGPSVPVPSTTTPSPVTAAPAPQQPGRWSWLDWLRNRWGFGRGRRLEAEHGWFWPWNNIQGNNIRGNNYNNDNSYVPLPLTSAPVAAPTPTPAPTVAPSTHYDGNNNNVDAITVNKETAEEKRVTTWYKKTMAKMGGQCAEAMADIERQMCMFENQCLGGTHDYPETFKATWGANEPRCLTIVNAIKCGEQKIKYGQWRQDMESYFGCPKPANATQSTGQNNANGDVIQSVTQSVTQTTTDLLSSVVQSV